MTLETLTNSRLRIEDTYEILAWLDYCISQGAHNKFKRTISGHLDRTCQKIFTWDQIDNHIKSLWNNSHIGHESYSRVYRLGSKAFNWCESNDIRREKVRTSLKRLKNESIPITASPQRTRKRGTLRVEIPRASPSRARGQSTRNPGYSKLFSNVHNKNSSRPKKRKEISPTTSYVENSEAIGSSITDNTDTQDEKVVSFRDIDRSRNSKQLEALQKQLAESEKELQYLRIEHSKSHDKIKQLERRMRCENSARESLVSGENKDNEKILSEYMNEVEILQDRLNDKETLTQFTTGRADRHIPFDLDYFQGNMEKIQCVIEQFMSYADMPMICDSSKLQALTDRTQHLLQRVMGSAIGRRHNASFHCLLRSLLSAAVCEWVLEPEFQDHFLASTALRDTMLLHLATQDGDDVARNLDFAAHYSLIEGDYFQTQIIPSRAEALASQLITSIMPIFLAHKPRQQWDMDIQSELNDHQRSLKTMFSSALKIKTRALVSKYIFEVVLPPQGTKYDQNLMDLEIEELESEDPLAENILDIKTAPLVRLCIAPGLKVYSFDRKLVDYNSFCKPGYGPERPFDLIAHARVINCS